MARPRLGRDSIVAAAFAVLARSGLDGVTARAVAAELGVQAGAIYYHLPDMATLLDEMATDVMRAMDPDREPPEDWVAFLTGYGAAIRSTLLAYRDGGRLFAGRRLRDPSLGATMEAPLGVLTRAGLGLAHAVWVLQTVLDLTVGFVIEEQHRAGSAGYDAAARAQAVGPELHPLAAAASTPLFGDPDERYAFALDLVIEGVRSRLR